MKRFRHFIAEDKEQSEYGSNPAVMSFGRMQPPTVAGHGKLIATGKNLANQMGAKHEVILSHTQDPEKNPLTPQQKLKHAQRLFPNTNISLANAELPTLIHHAARLNHEGHDHLTLVAGEDRVNEFQNLLDRYNGKPDKSGKIPFNFKHGVRVVSAGERDGDAESATKIRKLVSDGNKDEFIKRYPTLHPSQAEELYNDLANGMQKKKK